ncbi:MAG: aldo/keto reductase [Acidobacteria bacterium]|nr:aldo/keto reductase [Acidobacteriota bacterium]
MKRRRLGRTNLQVSEISLGTVELGLDYGIRPAGEDARPDRAGAARLLHRALDLGINYVDTARAYGEAEERIGAALGGRRSEFFLASKVLPGDPGSVAASVRQSLQALGTEVIDVMMIHSAPADVFLRSDVLPVLEGFRRQGHIRFLGASVYGEQSALAAIESGFCDCLQIAYSLLDRRPESRVLAAARERDVGIVARSVLLKGALTHRYRYLPEALAPLRRAVEQIDPDLPELAYRYVLHNPLVHTALAGTARVDELEAVAGYAAAPPLTGELLARIGAIRIEDESLLNPGNWPPLL